MNFIINFYQELDTLNLIIFWGVIVVILLLLIFSIVIANKNKKLKMAIKSNLKSQESTITKNETKENKPDIEIPITNESQEDIPEQSFNAEEHIIENQIFQRETDTKKMLEEPTTKVTTTINLDNIFPKEEAIKAPLEIPKTIKRLSRSTETTPTKAYQKNVLKNMSLNQTSPIGIINSPRKENTSKKEIILESPHKKLNNDNYLERISKEIPQSDSNKSIDRTNYELKQEEDAIISYKELLQKKDSIKIEDEEEAVISYEELLSKTNSSKTREKTYNLTEETENEKFIKELKNFREDLH